MKRNRLYGFVMLLAALSSSTQSQDPVEAAKAEAGRQLGIFANQALECVNHLAPYQCNSLDRCRETKALLAGVNNGSNTMQSVAVFTTNKNNCCCVQSMMGSRFIKNMLDAEHAKPEDLRYQGCYGQC